MHTNLVLLRKCDQEGVLRRYKYRLVVCGNEKRNKNEGSFSLIADSIPTKLIMCLTLEKGWRSRHLNFDSALPNGYLNRSVYVELPKYILTERDRRGEVTKLNRSLYDLRDAAKVGSYLLFEMFSKIGLKKIYNAPCIF